MFETDDGGSLDQFTFYLVDGAGTILNASQAALPFSLTFGRNLQTNFTAATGPFTVHLVDDTDTTPDQAVGTTFALTPFASQTFDANALDPDCPVAAAAAPTPSFGTDAAALAMVRGATTLANRPELRTRLDNRNSSGQFQANLTDALGTLSFASSTHPSGQNTSGWISAGGSYVLTGTRAVSGFIHTGIETSIGPDALAGLMFSLDYINSEANDLEGASQGFLVGPYAVWRIAPGTVVEITALAGRGRTDLQTSDSARASVTSNRRAITLALSGTYSAGSTTFHPEADIAYYSESTGSFGDSTGTTHGGFKTELLQSRIGADATNTGSVLGYPATWNGSFHLVHSETASASIPGPRGMSLSLGMGVDVTPDAQSRFSFQSGLHGIGDYPVLNLAAQIHISF